MAVGVLPISAASAQVSAADVEDICPAPGQTDAFTDDTENTFEDRINCAAAYGLVEGKTATTFDPTGFLTRGQAATLLVNYVEISNCDEPLVADATDDFTDVDGNVHEENIQKAADNGIVNGYSDNTFRPDQLISRAQFASLAVQATEVALGEDLAANAADPDFDDIAGNVHAENIEKAFDNGMLVGTSPRTFSPNQNVTRGQATSIVIGAAGQILFPAGEFCPAQGESGFQTIAVNPQDAATATVLADNTPAAGTTPAVANSTADDRTYTVAGLTNGETYRITLVNASATCETATGQDGFISGTDAASSTGFSATTGADIADIISVNNGAPTFADPVAPAVQESRTTTTQPVNGSITFTIDGTSLGTVVPVVYVDGGTGGTPTTGGTSQRLEVTATAAGQCAVPNETFGIGGPITFTAANATSGPVVGPVTGVDKATDSFLTGTGPAARRFVFDANDLFTITPLGGGAAVSVGIAAFEAALSSGDGISGTFTTDPAGVSTFDLVDSNPPAPTAVTADNGTGAASNDITVTVVIPAGTDVDTVVIQRAPVTGGTDGGTDGTVGTFATIATPTADANLAVDGFQFVDADVAAGTFRYQVALVNDGDQGPFTASANVASVTPTPADVAAPTITDARATDAGTVGILDVGDAIQLTFSEPMNVTTDDAGQLFRVVDADGTQVEITCGGNATCALQGAGTFNGTALLANRVLRVAITAPVTAIGPTFTGSVAGLQFPATITNVSAGFDDVEGNQLSLAGSSDVLINVDTITGGPTPPPAPTGPVATATVNDGNGDGNLEGGDEFVITFSEAINPAGVGTTATTLTINDSDGTTDTITCAADCVLTVGNTVLTIPNGGFPTGTTPVGGTPGFQGNLTVTDTTGLVAADDGTEVVTPFTITRVAGPAGL